MESLGVDLGMSAILIPPNGKPYYFNGGNYANPVTNLIAAPATIYSKRPDIGSELWIKSIGILPTANMSQYGALNLNLSDQVIASALPIPSILSLEYDFAFVVSSDETLIIQNYTSNDTQAVGCQIDVTGLIFPAGTYEKAYQAQVTGRAVAPIRGVEVIP